MSVKCSKCEKSAVYLRRYTNERLCVSCLLECTLDRVRRTINKYDMLKRHDRIAVAISGGKDSAALLDILVRIEDAYSESEILPFTIDEGIMGYRDEALKAAKKLVGLHGLDLHIWSFNELFGKTLDEIVKNRSDTSFGACSYCGVFRRKAMNDAAIALDADVVATGHIMDDEAQTILMNIMRGDTRRITRGNRFRANPVDGFIPRIKPLMGISQRDVIAYTHYMHLPYHDVPCPYAEEAYRSEVRIFLNKMEYRHPGTFLAILSSGDVISKSLLTRPSDSTFRKCDKCGSPTPRNVCKACSLLEEL
ncbi:MAG: TIGR00269 family protein [Candidatus Lokiarchaeota archaeon]|nr:TIGR00269 family protein [Candidatus Lokiarchaeota archaeon]